jgi:mannose-6-phosphate isomerase-like protein (cupin superfamily)
MIERDPRVLPYEVFDLERIPSSSGTLEIGDMVLRGYGRFSRIFFLSGVPHGRARAGHAHKMQAEFLIAVQGSVEAHIEWRGSADVVRLDRGRALYLPPGRWLDLRAFSEDALLAVLSADSFDESDYIRDRAAFRRWERGGR